MYAMPIITNFYHVMIYSIIDLTDINEIYIW